MRKRESRGEERVGAFRSTPAVAVGADRSTASTASGCRLSSTRPLFLGGSQSLIVAVAVVATAATTVVVIATTRLFSVVSVSFLSFRLRGWGVGSGGQPCPLKPQPFPAVILAVLVQAIQQGLELGKQCYERLPQRFDDLGIGTPRSSQTDVHTRGW